MNMQTIEPTFESNSLLFYTEEKILTPLVQILDNYPQRTSNRPFITDLFPEQKFEDKEVKKIRELLGDVAINMTSEEIKTFTAEVRYLCDSLLDSFERNLFQGMTLQELLNEG